MGVSLTLESLEFGLDENYGRGPAPATVKWGYK
jgi:hypothetical protein